MGRVRRPPQLSPEVVAEDQALANAIDALLARDRQMRVHRIEILRLQQELRAVASPETWQAYLLVEGASNARLERALRKVARWAFSEGRGAGP